MLTMRKIILLFLLVTLIPLCNINGQTLLSEDFSNGIPSDWTMFGDDNVAYNPSYRQPWVLNTQRGNNAPCAASTSWFNSVNQADRWLITSGMTIPATGYKLIFDVAALEDAYPDGIAVRISTQGNTDRSMFEDTAVFSVARCSSNWTEYTIDLSAYAGKSIHIAFVQQSLDMNLIMIDNIFVGIPAANALSLRQLYIPSSCQLNTPVELRGRVVNTGTANLTSFGVQYTVNGVLRGENYVSNINIPHGGSYTFTCSPNFSSSVMDKYHIVVSVHHPNGTDDDISDNSMEGDIVVFDSALLMPRTNLVELMLLDSCGSCPGAWQQAEMAIERAEGDYLMLAHHGGAGTDALTVEDDTWLDSLYNSPNRFVPAIAYNRARLSPLFPGPWTGVSSTMDELTDMMNSSNALPNFLYMQWNNAVFDETSRTFTGSLSGHFTYRAPYANPKLDIYLVEDSVLMPQATASGWNRSYRHAQVSRGVVSTLPIMGNNSFQHDVSFQLPATNKAWRCRLVAVVANNDPADANNNEVSTAVATDRFAASYIGIDQTGAAATIDLYPNPAATTATIEANSNIRSLTVMDAMGQRVYSNNNVEGSTIRLDVSRYPQGLYMVRVETTTGVTIHKMTVVR